MNTDRRRRDMVTMTGSDDIPGLHEEYGRLRLEVVPGGTWAFVICICIYPTGVLLSSSSGGGDIRWFGPRASEPDRKDKRDHD